MELINIKNVSKEFVGRQKTMAVQDINLVVHEGEFLCILGPSGCGKSTLLNLMGGFEEPTKGVVFINGNKVVEPDSQYISVFQNHGLLPWRNVIDNIRLGLEFTDKDKEEQKKIAEHYITLVGLDGVQNKAVHELSGGMKQRVAIARALAVNPKVLFMDEPFGALDEMTRLKLEKELLRIWKEEKITIVFVTHNIDDAIYLGDRIVVMGTNPGHIKEIINVTTERPRDLTSGATEDVKRRIFELFDI